MALATLLAAGCGDESARTSPPPAPSLVGNNGAGKPSATTAGQSLTAFATLIDHLSLDTRTEFYTQEYWRKVQNAEVTWQGRVVNVEGGRGRAEVYIRRDDGPTYRGYNIILLTFDTEKAGTLARNEDITFRGMLSKYRSRRGRPIIITLRGVEIL